MHLSTLESSFDEVDYFTYLLDSGMQHQDLIRSLSLDALICANEKLKFFNETWVLSRAKGYMRGTDTALTIQIVKSGQYLKVEEALLDEQLIISFALSIALIEVMSPDLDMGLFFVESRTKLNTPQLSDAFFKNDWCSQKNKSVIAILSSHAADFDKIKHQVRVIEQPKLGYQRIR